MKKYEVKTLSPAAAPAIIDADRFEATGSFYNFYQDKELIASFPVSRVSRVRKVDA